jgi:2'-5' RNA ligase
MMPVIRAFIAIDLSPEIQSKLEEVSSALRSRLKDAPVRWVPVGNIHLTLKFLGDVSLANLEMLKNILAVQASAARSFDVSVGDLGVFPSASRPRVVWVGIDAPPELAAFQYSIENETNRLGYAREDRDFSPHLTLGRVSRNASTSELRRISEGLSGYQAGFLGASRVSAVHLYRSDLRPGGAVYTRIFSAALAAHPESR